MALKFRSKIVLLFFCFISAVMISRPFTLNAQNSLDSENDKQILARFSEIPDSEGRFFIYFYSNKPLQNPQILVNDAWIKLTPAKVSESSKDFHVYTMGMRVYGQTGRQFVLRAKSEASLEAYDILRTVGVSGEVESLVLKVQPVAADLFAKYATESRPKTDAVAADKPASSQAALEGLTPHEQSIVQRTNALRARVGLAPLEVDPALMYAAKQRAAQMAQRGGQCIHDMPLLSRLARGRGFLGQITENVGWSQVSWDDPVMMTDGWWTSSVGHGEQMKGRMKMNGQWIDMGFNRIGVAVQGKHWIQVFGRR